MDESSTQDIRQVVEGVYRSESRRVLATLIRLIGDFDLAEEALHEAFAAAVEQWSHDGVPSNPPFAADLHVLPCGSIFQTRR